MHDRTELRSMRCLWCRVVAIGMMVAALARLAQADTSTLAAGEGESEAVPSACPVPACSPEMRVFPVAGPHNIGYDPASCVNVCALTCPDDNANSDWGGDHHGIDVFGAYRVPLVAVASGTVERVGVASDSSGLRVAVRDGCGWEYYYGHMDEAVVGEGQVVQAGQRIGYMGQSGPPGIPVHLHFNVSYGGYYCDIDPLDLLASTSATACPDDTGDDGCVGACAAAWLSTVLSVLQ